MVLPITVFLVITSCIYLEEDFFSTSFPKMYKYSNLTHASICTENLFICLLYFEIMNSFVSVLYLSVLMYTNELNYDNNLYIIYSGTTSWYIIMTYGSPNIIQV